MLLEAVRTAFAVDPATYGERQRGEVLADLAAVRDLVTARLAGLVADQRQETFASKPSVVRGSVRSWAAGQVAAAQGDRSWNKLLHLADARVFLPRVAALWESGTVSTGFVEAALAGMTGLSEPMRAALDALLAGAGRDCDPADLAQVCEQLKAVDAPREKDARADAAAGRARLQLSPVGSDGEWALNGQLQGSDGERLHCQLMRYAAKNGPDDHRPLSQRLAQALVMVARIAEDAVRHPEYRGPSRGADAHLSVIVTEPAAQEAARAERPHPARPGQAAEEAPAAAVTAGGQVVDSGELATLLCKARSGRVSVDLIHGLLTDTSTGTRSDGARGSGPRNVSPQSVSPQNASPRNAARRAGVPSVNRALGERLAELLRQRLAGVVPAPVALTFHPLNLGRERRVGSEPQFRGLLTRDGQQCVRPGCTRTGDWLEIHHLLEHSEHNGPTDLSNLALYCWPDHLHLHRTQQHVHPPWCGCDHCAKQRANGLPDRWKVRSDLPRIE